MRLFSLLVFCSFSFQNTEGQNKYAEFSGTIQAFYKAKGQAEINHLWNDMVSVNKIPLIAEDSVAFLYRGEAKRVIWMGDFNGWGNDKKFDNNGKRIPGTDVWILKTSLPKDARLDYKIFINGTNWILDPENPISQWSGVGGGSPNSELRMPEWKEDPLTTYLLPEAHRGTIKKDLLLNSQSLGYQITYSVYVPKNYQEAQKHSIVYVTDGYEYMHERMGNMITVLDNLIHLGKIKPVVAVFIDHREPVNRSLNRRMKELAMNEKYLNFITQELIPAVEEKYTISKEPSQRAILGNSMGGLSAAYFAFSRPEIFGLAGIQSPAFWFKPEIYALCDNTEDPPIKIFLTTGVIHDSEEGARKMQLLLKKNTCTYEFKEVNQGHSWGNWRDLIDDILIYFYPPE